MSARLEETRWQAARAIREMLERGAHIDDGSGDLQLGAGWAEDVVEKLTDHVLAVLEERAAAAAVRGPVEIPGNTVRSRQ